MSKEKLCEACYLYITATSAFMEMEHRNNEDEAKVECFKILKSLPNGLHIFKDEAKQTLKREVKIRTKIEMLRKNYAFLVDKLADSFDDDDLSAEALKT